MTTSGYRDPGGGVLHPSTQLRRTAGEVDEKLNTTSQHTEKISVIIPALNESHHLARTLETAATGRNVEVIVVDAESTDDTRSIAERHRCQVVSSVPGRAAQMNAGAAEASGSILLFLHADTQLPAGYDGLVRRTLQEDDVIAGAFRLRLAAPGFSMRLIEWAANLRSRSFGVPYGDQAIFLRVSEFEAAGGFPELPIMEDYQFMHDIRRRGRIRIVSADVSSSARRWKRLGCFRTTFVNQLIILGYRSGVSPKRLASWYSAK